jgi:hypothetical protein
MIYLIKKLNFYFNLNIQNITLWLAFIDSKILGIYPPLFYIALYFNNLYLKNNQFKQIWGKRLKYPAEQIALQGTQHKEDDYYSF